MRNDGPSVVTTKTLRADGGYTTSYELYDGLLRERSDAGARAARRPDAGPRAA